MRVDKKSLRTPDYLRHMVDAITQIESYVEDLNEGSFASNRLVIDAVIRNIEILGEAARNIEEHDAEFASRHRSVPWRAMYTMRNRLAHGYFSVDEKTVWLTIKNDLPELKKQILDISPAPNSPQ